MGINCCYQEGLDKPRVGEDYSKCYCYTRDNMGYTYTISIVMLNFNDRNIGLVNNSLREREAQHLETWTINCTKIKENLSGSTI